ncbi:MAG: glycosyl hydrolase family 28 protein [Firmicutes bacterium]|jgi:polygalacturonase|nr:glycosyl hydrolase family 28 protein [Bacillota bacterium]
MIYSTMASFWHKGKLVLASAALLAATTAFSAAPIVPGSPPATPSPTTPVPMPPPTPLPGPNTVSPYLSQLPFASPDITPPQIAPKVFTITQYGAEANNLSPMAIAANTTAINTAIADASKSGGGEVVIPAGLWVTGSIVMQSNVNLHTDNGAVVEFTANHDAYPLITQFGQKTYQAPIYAVGLSNIAITGSGIFNGSGNTWNPVKEFQLTNRQWQTLLQSGGVVNNQTWYPSAQIEQDQNLIPFMVLVLNSKNILINGPTFENSPSEAMYINFSSNVIVSHTKVLNTWYSVNTVGVDVASDHDFLMYDDTINTGDDGIVLNASPGSQPDTVNNIVIQDSTIYNAHGGFAVGSYTDGGVKDVYVNNVNMIGTEDGIRFKSAVGRGGLVQDVYLNNIHMQNIQDYAITFNSDYNNQSPATGSLTTLTNVPQFQNIYFNNFVCDYAGEAIRINGLPYAPVSDVFFNNVSIKAAQQYLIDNTSNVSTSTVSYTYAQELGLVPHYGVDGPA